MVFGQVKEEKKVKIKNKKEEVKKWEKKEDGAIKKGR